ISGYVGWKHRLTVTGTAGTWLLVAWHTVLITALTALLKPEWLPKGAWKRAFLPVSTKEYWYVTAYFIMLLFIPLMHFILKRISTLLLWIWVGSFLFVHSFLATLNWKAYGMNHGYNCWWLIGMYLLGAALERSKKVWEAHAKLIGAVLFIAGAVPAYLLIVLADNRNWIDYCSPLTIISAAGAVICFSGMKLQRISRVIRTVSPTALAIFVIHVHTITWNHVFYSWPRSHGLWKTASVPRMSSRIISTRSASGTSSVTFRSAAVRRMTSIASLDCSGYVTHTPPCLSVPHFSAAIAATVSPSTAVWSSETETITLTSGQPITFVASSRPPRPVSSTTTSQLSSQ
ncbi:MAG: acyltransferase family protein, partial [Lachnospiraceae bacterium]|nr:acyltransferase family protein [Lachnospiraceae bacterium]